MRHLAIISAILLITVSANAAVQIGVNGVLSPSDVDVQVGTTAGISIWTDSAMGYGFDFAAFFLGIPEGEPGTIYADDPLLHPYVVIEPWPEEPPIPGFGSWVVFSLNITGPDLPADSILIDNIIFRCEGPGNVNLLLFGTQDYAEWTMLDTQVIHQIPEPATIALLGFGAILLKRRR